jgi:hypothetical protein
MRDLRTLSCASCCFGCPGGLQLGKSTNPCRTVSSQQLRGIASNASNSNVQLSPIRRSSSRTSSDVLLLLKHRSARAFAFAGSTNQGPEAHEPLHLQLHVPTRLPSPHRGIATSRCSIHLRVPSPGPPDLRDPTNRGSRVLRWLRYVSMFSPSLRLFRCPAFALCSSTAAPANLVFVSSTSIFP